MTVCLRQLPPKVTWGIAADIGHLNHISSLPLLSPEYFHRSKTFPPARNIHCKGTCASRTDILKEEGSGLPAHAVMSSVSTPARFYLLGSCCWDFLTYYLVNLSLSSHTDRVQHVPSPLFNQGPLSCLTISNSSTDNMILLQGSRACDVLPLDPAMSPTHLLLHWYL